MAFTHINFVAFLFKGDVEGGRKSILEGIKIREELGVQLYVAAGNCDLGREKLNNRLTRLYKHQLLYLLIQATRLLLSSSNAALIRVNMVISRIIDRESKVSAVRLHRGKNDKSARMQLPVFLIYFRSPKHVNKTRGSLWAFNL